jgi:hypothetical protein
MKRRVIRRVLTRRAVMRRVDEESDEGSAACPEILGANFFCSRNL